MDERWNIRMYHDHPQDGFHSGGTPFYRNE
jgi:hypothetical protein